MNKGQFLVEALLILLLIILLSLSIFIVFNTIPNVLKYSDDSLIVYNLCLSYQNKLLGISREKFSVFDELVDDVDYYLEETSGGFNIQEGKEKYDIKGGEYYVWFKIKNPNIENDPNKKLLEIFVQTPSFLYTTNLILTRYNEKVLVQDEWTIVNSGPLTTIINEFSTSQNVITGTTIYLP